MDAADNIRRIKEQASLPKQPKIRKPIAKVSEKKKKQLRAEKELIEQAREFNLPAEGDQEQWFIDRMAENVPVCMNCGMEAAWLLQPEYEKIWRACQAHILPKRKAQFPSVATHPLNHLILFPVWGGHLCGCHDEYDSGWYNATTMKVWGLAKSKFKQFESAIAPSERRRIPEQLLK